MTDDAATLPVGTRIDRYEIFGVLGRGASTIVYFVRDDELEKEFALKEFFPHDLVRRDGGQLRFFGNAIESRYSERLGKFYDDARLLAHLDHPNIVSIRRVFEANSSAYMLLEFIDGITLRRWLQELSAPPSQAQLDQITRPLLSALEMVHSKQALHLGVAPDNIIVRTPDEVPVLIGFGSSYMREEPKRWFFNLIKGRPASPPQSPLNEYSAPEQDGSTGRLGAHTDIYGLGATIYRAVVGEGPPAIAARQLGSGSENNLRSFGGRYREGFLKAVASALELRPEARPQTIDEFRRMLLSQG